MRMRREAPSFLVYATRMRRPYWSFAPEKVLVNEGEVSRTPRLRIAFHCSSTVF